MSGMTPLDRLAAAHRIEPVFTDNWQSRYETSAETNRALLTAMGVLVDSDRAIAESLEAVAVEALERPVPAVLVRQEGERIVLPLTIDAGRRGRLVWTFRAEDGVERAGEARLDELDVTERIGDVLRYALPLPVRPPPGYHRCTLALDGPLQVETEVIVTPRRCFQPEGLDGERSLTGLTVPLYGLRSGRNAGIGDLTDLADLASATAPLGADFIGINPTHALFPTQAHRISPYAPSNRHVLNVLLIALDKVPELEASPTARAMLESADVKRLRAADLVAYQEVSKLKLAVLEALFQAFSRLPDSAQRKSAFRAFYDAAGPSLTHHARFDALSEHMLRHDPSNTDWRRWPAGFRAPDAAGVQAFASRHADRVTFYTYLQWLAAEQQSEAQRRAIDAGMALGVYRDLAVGVAPDGAEAWSAQNVLIDGVRIGAPPDDFNPKGQNWGLLPFSPAALEAERYHPFIDLIRHNMSAAGALRIDHVLGFARSFWLPAADAAPGAYVRYPMKDLLGLVALESQRNQCLVVGEDLGTVPETLRSALDDHGLLGCRLLYFEQDRTGTPQPASAYPRNCIASIGTHDLPTLKGFWEGRDLEWRERLGLYPDQEKQGTDREAREKLKAALLQRLMAEGLLPDDIDPGQP
ncbi:MAG: 4-alpha-glucanotransferase, partial [Alphaproteobacteria bacterium]|nr:4-alpha-glucanotransferase [Alphaproteobacteria bacterium]